MCEDGSEWGEGKGIGKGKTDVRGTKTRRTAFSCTCQPNMYDVYPHSVNARRKLLYVGSRHSFARKTFKRTTCVSQNSSRTTNATDHLERERDDEGVQRFDVRHDREDGIAHQTATCAAHAGIVVDGKPELEEYAVQEGEKRPCIWCPVRMVQTAREGEQTREELWKMENEGRKG